MHLVARMDPVGRAEEDDRADWATATAWNLMAENGPRGDLGQPFVDHLVGTGATPQDLAALETTLSMLAGDMRSDPRTRRIASDFQFLIGVETAQEGTALLLLRRLLIEGRAAAHAQRTAALSVEAGIAEEIPSRSRLNSWHANARLGGWMARS
ncbi:hypothetical protein [Szabonella alba]|uniref:Uncharacterized protein n=1 Tax=Szabonella alba TaxID=2804194 RepID=A0A8K0VB18_9RHOB|nr:hypothetical protein [Szabonella alba]MBL4918787.1 hypothetical protein [Szabonella alba]